MSKSYFCKLGSVQEFLLSLMIYVKKKKEKKQKKFLLHIDQSLVTKDGVLLMLMACAHWHMLQETCNMCIVG